jgi:hypothetical protein
MKTILEIFYVRIKRSRLHYRRKQVNLSRRGSDPDRIILSLIMQKRHLPSRELEEKEFLIHSTSWRYERPGNVILTYVAYSDEFEFPDGKTQSMSLKQLRTIAKTGWTPRSAAEVEKKVVCHAMRHISFLIRTDKEIDFESAMTPETMEIFSKLWVSLAGRVRVRRAQYITMPRG